MGPGESHPTSPEGDGDRGLGRDARGHQTEVIKVVCRTHLSFQSIVFGLQSASQKRFTYVLAFSYKSPYL